MVAPFQPVAPTAREPVVIPAAAPELGVVELPLALALAATGVLVATPLYSHPRIETFWEVLGVTVIRPPAASDVALAAYQISVEGDSPPGDAFASAHVFDAASVMVETAPPPIAMHSTSRFPAVVAEAYEHVSDATTLALAGVRDWTRTMAI